MKNNLTGLILLLCAGCAPVPPEWESSGHRAAEAEFVNASTQLELTAAAGEMAISAEDKMIEALDYKLSTLSERERLRLLREQGCWQRWVDGRNAEPMGDGSIARMLQLGRAADRMRNRFLELTVPEKVRQTFIAMRELPVRFNGRQVGLSHGELDIDLPADRTGEELPKFETVGQLQIPLCRTAEVKGDTFQIGVIEPTNYGVVSSFGVGTESNLCIWKNGVNSANYLIGREITIEDVTVDGNTVNVHYRDKDGKENRSRFDLLNDNEEPVRINHWTTEKFD